MSGRHRTKSSRSNVVIGSIAATVGVSSALAAAIVELVEPDAPAATSPSAPPAAAQQPLTQQGRLIAVTPNSLTTQGVDGSVQTFSIDARTTAITDDGRNGGPAASFAVNDQVMVMGNRQGDAVVATAVADQSAVGPQGRPMDFGL
ncbi:MAG: hypothetical protein ACXVGO_06515 [Mycobacterium sp.]